MNNKMNNKKPIGWIIAVITLPFIVMFGLHIGIALGNYFHININVPNIDASSWFMFFGSYLAGVMTLTGVLITLKHERKMHQYEKSLENIDKERERIGNAICGFNLLAPRSLYGQINEMLVSPMGISSPDIIVLRQKVNEEMHKALVAKTELEFATDIFFMAGDCAACKKPCKIQSIIPEFIKMYDLVGTKIYNTLNKIDNYIFALERNQACRLAGLETQTVDIKPYQAEIDAALEEIAKFNENEIQRLLVLGRTYIEQKKQNAYKKCFPIKES